MGITLIKQYFLVMLLLGFSPLSQALLSENQNWLIKSVNVLDITDGEYASNTDVYIEQGIIKKIGKKLQIENVEIIEGNGKYLVPGWTEMHAHVPPGKTSKENLDELFFLYSAYGITTIRGMLGAPWHLELREQIANNKLHAPTLFTSGPSFNGNSIHSSSFASGKVKAQRQKGYDFLKVHPGMEAQEYRAMANTAHDLGIDFSGHVTADVGAIESAKLGQGTIDHLDGVIVELVRRSGKEVPDNAGFFGSNIAHLITKSTIKPLAEELAQSGISLIPTESLMFGFLSPLPGTEEAKDEKYSVIAKSTLKSWTNTREQIINDDDYDIDKFLTFIEVRKTFIGEFHNAGGNILVGADAPQVFNVPGDALHVEMKLMMEAGMTPLEVLQAASYKSAQFLKQTHSGEIKQGFQANLVLLNKNPLSDINNSREIAGVMTRGLWLDESTIATRLEVIKKYHQ